MKNKKPYSHFIWLDFKTTGINPQIDKINTITIRITDGDMNIINNNSLYLELNGDPKNIKKVEKDLIDFSKSILPEGVKAPIAGYNTSVIERPFVRTFFKNFEKECLHYRNLDISSIEMIAKNIYPELKLPKKNKNKESIEAIDSAIRNTVFLRDKIFKNKIDGEKSVFKQSNKKSKTPYLIWTDLETTGLEPLENKIIEIATIITDGNLDIIDENSFQEIVKINQDDINNGSEIAINMHKENGLLYKCLNADISKTIENAEKKTIEFIKTVIPEGIKAPLAGNSIGSLDKPFIKEQMPTLNRDYLTPNSLDVTSFTMLAKNFIPNLEMPKKSRNHLAMDDIIESINELKFIKENILKSSNDVINKRKHNLKN